MSRFALFFAALSFLYASALHSQDRPPAPVIVAEVLEKKIHSDITLVGTVQPRRSSLVASETDGKVVTRFKDGGQQVRVNDPIFRLNNDQLEASLIEARADVELQKSNHTRNLELLKTEAVSEQDLRDSEYQLARARAKLQNLESSYEALHIVAPFNGHIVQTFTEVGEWVKRGDGIAQVISTDTVRVYVNVPEKYVNLLRLGNRVDIFIDALGSTAVQGQIVAILAEGYAESHSFPVVVETPNPTHRIRSHMSARVSFRIEQPEIALLVHKDALINTPAGQVVYIALDGKSVQRSVQTGLPYQGYVAVKSGLRAGDQAIVRGNERLRDGQDVKVIRKLQ